MSNTSVHPNNDYVCLCFINGVLSEEEPKEHDNVVYVIGVRPVGAVPTRGDVRYDLPPSGPNVPRCTICQVALKGSETHAYSNCGCLHCDACVPADKVGQCGSERHKDFGCQKSIRIHGLFNPCKACQNPLRSPTRPQNCGHVFCRECLDSHWDIGYRICWYCREQSCEEKGCEVNCCRPVLYDWAM
ncbi:hypothetical protein F5Y08DRAFT_319890 [Xylaria arbuscula]|nr:hypothetical protein F5Y08DRAFT_319890 [Xylaria arbuscula]